MKGQSNVIAALNSALTIELTAVNQYFLQARMCRNWGYSKLAKKHYDEAIEEMRHAEALIDRILFLEGAPNISKYDPIRIGENVQKQFENDLKLEVDGVKYYNQAINMCVEAKDAGSREIMEHILTDSEEHVDWLETQLHVIKNVGLENYLSEQIGEPDKKA